MGDPEKVPDALGSVDGDIVYFCDTESDGDGVGETTVPAGVKDVEGV